MTETLEKTVDQDLSMEKYRYLSREAHERALRRYYNLPLVYSGTCPKCGYGEPRIDYEEGGYEELIFDPGEHADLAAKRFQAWMFVKLDFLINTCLECGYVLGRARPRDSEPHRQEWERKLEEQTGRMELESPK